MVAHLETYCCLRVQHIQAIIYDGMVMEQLIARYIHIFTLSVMLFSVQPQQTKTPSNNDFYWKFVLPAATGISPQMFPIVLQTVSNLTLAFQDRTPHVVSGTPIIMQ